MSLLLSTLRLIVKNVTGLSPEGKREEGMAMVNDIILSYQVGHTRMCSRAPAQAWGYGCAHGC
jgi:hypothetical protein